MRAHPVVKVPWPVRSAVGRLVMVLLAALSYGSLAPAQSSLLPANDPGTPALRQAVSNGWVRLQISAGRLELAGLPVGNVSTSSSRPGVQERLTVRNANAVPALDYQRTTSTSKLTIHAEGRRFDIQFLPLGSAELPAVQFSQQADQPLMVQVATRGRQEVFLAKSLWHLLVVHTEPSRKYLVPLIELLRPDWNLAALGEAVEQALLRQAGSPPPDVSALDELVAQLGDPSFGVRVEAERRLRASGSGVLGYLESLDLDRLDAEQRFRLRRTMAALRSGLEEARPEQIASWLSGDVEVWLALLQRADASTRQLAARQIEARLGEPIGVDPQRDPAEQEVELDRLRERLERAGLLVSSSPSPPAAESPSGG